MIDIEKLLAKTDLRELVEKAGGTLDHDRCACPLHGSHNSNSFAVYRKDGRDLWKCHSGDCGSGDAIDFLRAWRGFTFYKACEFLGADTQSDPIEMKRLADERHAKALIELADKQRRVEAARRELQVASKHLLYHSGMKQWARDMWTGRGLDEGMQDFFTLGACEDFTINTDYHTPTLTIPILSETRELLNIKHRLVNPQKPKDKYRPEMHGLGTFPPLLAIPEMGYDGGLVIVVEGEIKAMVTWCRLSEPDIQVIGVGGKGLFCRLAENLQGKNIVIIPDPLDVKEAMELAKKIKARVLNVPQKIDDYILANDLKGDNFYSLIRQARAV